jgi:hypothetical protein
MYLVACEGGCDNRGRKKMSTYIYCHRMGGKWYLAYLQSLLLTLIALTIIIIVIIIFFFFIVVVLLIVTVSHLIVFILVHIGSFL